MLQKGPGNEIGRRRKALVNVRARQSPEHPIILYGKKRGYGNELD